MKPTSVTHVWRQRLQPFRQIPSIHSRHDYICDKELQLSFMFAGLLYGIGRGWDWQKTGSLAALMGSIKIAHRGGQNPRFEEIHVPS